ncbi:MAG: cysteine hydrolase [Defluviitaleaceae bacterium]|nr:cysteine hydrolase [Defluviitaleaceae bacterium]
MKALINIDYTNDFVAQNGALTCGAPGQAIEAAITQVTEDFIKNGDFVVFAVDIHWPGDCLHPETKLFPPHNIAGTGGRGLYGRLGELYRAHKDAGNVYWMDKTRYSAFAGTDLFIRLRERGIDEIYVAGVCTDICVLHTLVDAYNLGFKLNVCANAVASFDQAGHEWALRHFEGSLGAKIVK